MNPRERNLLIITILVVILGGGYYFMPEDFSLGGDVGAGNAAAESRRFEEYREWIERGPSVEREYRGIEATFPQKVGTQSAESTFSNELFELIKVQGWDKPTINPARREIIEDVEDYYFIDLDVANLVGPAQKIIDVIAELRRNGLLIKHFKIRKANVDRDLITLNVTVSRLARFTAEEKKRMNKKRR